MSRYFHPKACCVVPCCVRVPLIRFSKAPSTARLTLTPQNNVDDLRYFMQINVGTWRHFWNCPRQTGSYTNSIGVSKQRSLPEKFFFLLKHFCLAFLMLITLILWLRKETFGISTGGESALDSDLIMFRLHSTKSCSLYIRVFCADQRPSQQRPLHWQVAWLDLTTVCQGSVCGQFPDSDSTEPWQTFQGAEKTRQKTWLKFHWWSISNFRTLLIFGQDKPSFF